MDFNELLKLRSIESYDVKAQLDILAELVDQSHDNHSIDGIELALHLSSQINTEKLQRGQEPLMHYFIANAWNNKRNIQFKAGFNRWSFRMEEISKELFHLRKAISSIEFEKLNEYRRCQVFTNLGNLFSFIGRFVEAQEAWSKALTIRPNFSMALANIGLGLFRYSEYIFDRYHHSIFKVYSYFYLKLALTNKKDIHPLTLQELEAFYLKMDKIIPDEYKKQPPPLNDYSLGKNKLLLGYRKWALKNILYINPINDLGPYYKACHDSLNMPTLSFEADSPPNYISLFNEIKQSFGTARFLYYEYIKNPKKHYSDKDIVLIETNEAALFSFSQEKAKLSFGLAYSLFDKIAFFLNDYFKLNIPLQRIKFGTIWYADKKEGSLRQPFDKSENWALRGLYWLYKDLHEIDNVKNIVEPDAEKLAAIRNHIEHRSLKVVENSEISKLIYDVQKDISYTISKADFDSKIFRMLKLSRAAIMYLSFAIYYEELKNRDPTKKNKVTSSEMKK